MRELTPADAVTTTRIIENPPASNHSGDGGFASPDGRRFVIRTAHGDVSRNGVWVDVYTGHLDSLALATHPRLCAHLFTTGLGSALNNDGTEFDPQPSNLLRWFNNHEVQFLWTDRRNVRQVLSVDLNICKHRFLTNHATSVNSFGASADGTLLFDAQRPPAQDISKALWAKGFTVANSADAWAILAGDISGTSLLSRTFDNEWFESRRTQAPHPITLTAGRIDPSNPEFREIAVQPRGRYALTTVGLLSVPPEWGLYTDASLQSVLDASKTLPGRIPLSLVVVDLQSGTAHPLWNAPKGFRAQTIWSPRRNTVVVAPTFLPIATDRSSSVPAQVSAAGGAAAEVDVATGEYRVLPVDLRSRVLTGVSWKSPDSIEMASTDLSGADQRTQGFKRNGAHWEISPPDIAPEVSESDSAAAPVHLEVHESLNRPPQVFAVDQKAGDRELVLDPNPHLLERFKLGRVERRSGTLPNGRQWLGQLTYPAGFVPGERYPLVIQGQYAKPWGKEEFTLYGPWGTDGMGLGPSLFASYSGQLLATRGIAVLEFEVLHPAPGPTEAEDIQLGLETVAEDLASSGLIDRSRIALVGFSRNGYWVEFTLAHSKFPFAAAVAADNYDPSYIQSALGGWREADAAMNGGPAFGDGLQKWLTHATGFNAEFIHTPLLMIGQSGGIPIIMSKWEIYSRLRFLHKPVEMAMMPEADRHPAHLPQNPRQITTVEERVIDWLSFWLIDRESGSANKREQYARWRAFRDSRILTNPQL